jgi:hypothetical protein
MHLIIMVSIIVGILKRIGLELSFWNVAYATKPRGYISQVSSPIQSHGMEITKLRLMNHLTSLLSLRVYLYTSYENRDLL